MLSFSELFGEPLEPEIPPVCYFCLEDGTRIRTEEVVRNGNFGWAFEELEEHVGRSHGPVIREEIEPNIAPFSVYLPWEAEEPC